MADRIRGSDADTLTGKVVKITDGDTLYVLDANNKQHKIRLAGIDAPERRQQDLDLALLSTHPRH